MSENIVIRECTTHDELAECVRLQTDVFAMPERELSPVRHLVVTREAGGFSLGAFDGGRLIGFVLSVPAFLRGERAFYSHMTAVRPEYQGSGIGAMLKWAQRARALDLDVNYIKWTFEPVRARNAYFNLEKLGVIVREFKHNFYGTDYVAATGMNTPLGLASDRLFAEWHLESPRVAALAAGDLVDDIGQPARTIEIANDWQGIVAGGSEVAVAEQTRVRDEFEAAFARGLVAARFRADAERPAYLLYQNIDV